MNRTGYDKDSGGILFFNINVYQYGIKSTEMMQKTHKQGRPLSRKTGIYTGLNLVCFLHNNTLSFSTIST